MVLGLRPGLNFSGKGFSSGVSELKYLLSIVLALRPSLNFSWKGFSSDGVSGVNGRVMLAFRDRTNPASKARVVELFPVPLISSFSMPPPLLLTSPPFVEQLILPALHTLLP